MDAGVLCIAYRALDTLKETIPAISRTPNCVLWDNSEEPEVSAWLVANAACPVLVSPNVGFSQAVNSGIEALGRHDWYVVVNPDVLVTDGWVDRLLSLGTPPLDDFSLQCYHNTARGLPSMDHNPRCPRSQPGEQSLGVELTTVGIVGAELVTEGWGAVCGGVALPFPIEITCDFRANCNYFEVNESWLLQKTRFVERKAGPGSFNEPEPVVWTTFGLAAIRRECWEAVGGLDTNYFLYCSDTKFCLEASRLGWETWYNPVSFQHLRGESMRFATAESLKRAKQDMMRFSQEERKWVQ